MLLRNHDLHGGLINGTRIQIVKLGDKLLQGRRLLIGDTVQITLRTTLSNK